MLDLKLNQISNNNNKMKMMNIHQKIPTSMTKADPGKKLTTQKQKSKRMEIK